MQDALQQYNGDPTVKIIVGKVPRQEVRVTVSKDNVDSFDLIVTLIDVN